MAAKKQDQRPDVSKMGYEQAIEELESINRRIEEGEIGLQDSLAEFRRGMALAKRCREILDSAEQEVQQIKTDQIPEG